MCAIKFHNDYNTETKERDKDEKKSHSAEDDKVVSSFLVSIMCAIND